MKKHRQVRRLMQEQSSNMGGTFIITNEMIKEWPTKEKIDAIIFGHGALGDYGNYTKIKFALYDLLDRIESLEEKHGEKANE